MLVYYFVPFIVSNRYLLFWVSNGHNSLTIQNQTHVYMNFFDHKDLGNHLLQLCPKVMKHPVYTRNLDNLHIPSTSLALVQKGVLYTGSKIFNNVLLHIKNTSRDHTLFKNKIKKYLYQRMFYSLDEYYQLQYN